MTFKNLQDRVMGRLNLTSTEARDRIKNFINERYRSLQTSINLGRVRRTEVTFPTVIGTFEYVRTDIIKPLTVRYPAGNRVVDERTLDQIRMMDADAGTTGAPQVYAVVKYAADGCTLYIWPKPDAVYTLSIDGLARGTNMSADGDIPAFPEDFHDILEFAATADELEKMEKPDQSVGFETRTEKRTRELRYFLAKSAYLGQQQNDFWWAGPWPTGYFGWFGGWV